MNLGQAAAVVMYELGRAEQGKRKDNAEARRTQSFAEGRGAKTAPLKTKDAAPRRGMKEEFAEMETVERIGEALLEALRKSGYIAARGEAKAEEKLRRMLRRFSMEAADAEVLLGMVRKILWKLDERDSS